MVSITASDVQEIYGEQTTSLDPGKQDALVQVAERLTENVFDGRVSRFTEIEGDTEDFTKYVAAHLWEIAERKRLNNEFQTGFSADVEGMRSDPESALSGTPYGNIALTMLRGRASIGIVRADY
jgi:hypothetical protein